jgi:lambda family phage minor tail protein L
MTIEALSQLPSTDSLVSLFTLDTTPIGGEVLYFTPGPIGGAFVNWNGNAYTPVPIESSGWEWNGQGALPQPTIKFANVNRYFNSLIEIYDDLVGLEITRTRTFKQFLDGESEADPTAHFPIDYYVIEQKLRQNKVFVEWTLSARLDQQGTQLPRRQILQNACTHRYRIWDPVAETFDYTNATCPYTGTDYFDEEGNVAGEASLDRCGKKLSDCRKRFVNEQLPTRAFPGVSRVRI